MIKSVYRYFNKGGLLKDSSILLTGTICVNVLNVLFQMFMGRYLEPQEYALLAALLGVFNILSTPLGVLVSTFNRYSSLLMRENRAGDVIRLGMHWGIRLVIIGSIPTAACFIIPQHIAYFFNLDRVEPVYIFGLILIGMFCRPVVNGILMGMQRFSIWCLGNVIGAIVRLVVGSALVLLISPFAGWGLLGHGIGFYCTILVGSAFILSAARSTPATKQPLPKIESFLFGSFFVLFGYSILMTADIVLVKNMYPEFSADFAYAATLARLVLLVPMAFIGAMFPKVVALGKNPTAQLNMMKKTLVMSFLSTGFAATTVSLLAGFLPRIIYGQDEISADLIRWLRMLSMIMIPVALINVFIQFLLAQRQLLRAGVVFVSASIYVGCSYMLTSSVDGILFSLAVVSVLTFFLLGTIIYSDAKNNMEKC